MEYDKDSVAYGYRLPEGDLYTQLKEVDARAWKEFNDELIGKLGIPNYTANTGYTNSLSTEDYSVPKRLSIPENTYIYVCRIDEFHTEYPDNFDLLVKSKSSKRNTFEYGDQMWYPSTILEDNGENVIAGWFSQHIKMSHSYNNSLRRVSNEFAAWFEKTTNESSANYTGFYKYKWLMFAHNRDILVG